MKTMLKVLSLAAVLAASTTFAMADTLTPFANSSTFGTNTGVTASGTLTPIPPAHGDPHPFTAKYTETVFEGGSSAFCSTCLNYVFDISDTSAANITDFIDSISISSFGALVTSEGYVNSGNIVPSSVSNIGGIITFDYISPVIHSGKHSDRLVIFTNATQSTPGQINFQDGAQVNGPALVGSQLDVHHLNPAPEPGSLMLLGTGLLTAVGVARRKFKA